MTKITIVYKRRKIEILNFKKLSAIGKITGLIFKRKDTKILLFEFNKDTKMPIHSYFVFFPFLAVWLDKNNNVLSYKIVRPFTSIIKPEKKFRKLIEIPFNNDNYNILGFFVGKRKV